MRKESGCETYVRCSADINFPGEEIRCDLCPCMAEHPRNQCRLTGEYLRDIRTHGIWCPLRIKEDIKPNERPEDKLLF